MVKLKAGQIQSFLKVPDPSFQAILLYGPDAGLIRERAVHLGKSIVENLSDPFRVTTLTSRDLSEDPSLLADEVGALSMMGGRRLIRIKEATENLSRILGAVLDNSPSENLIIIEAGDLSARSGLRKLVENASRAVTVPCYTDEGQTLQSIIYATLNQNGLTPDKDAMAYLITHLGGDRQVTLSELEKVCLYKGAGENSHISELTLEDVQAVIGDSSALTVDDAVRATTMGEPETMERALDLCFSSNLPSIQILRAHLRHFQRLYITAGHIQNGLTAESAMNKLVPRIFFKEQGYFRQQLNMWPLKKIKTAIQLLEEAEIQCKSTGYPDIVICRRTLLRLARAAKSK